MERPAEAAEAAEMQNVDVQGSRCQEATRLLLLREKYEALQARGADAGTLACLHEACEAKKGLYGPRHQWTCESVQDYATCVNIVAAKYLRTGEIDNAQKLLLKAHDLLDRDDRASSATLINLAVCRYSREMPEDAISYLTAADGSAHYFRAERHLNLCAAHFKRKGLERALFHAQSAARFAQIAVTDLASRNLPACFSKEALVLLALAYHSLGVALVSHGYRRSWSCTGKQERERGVVQMLEGVKWHIKAYEEVALGNKWAVPSTLTHGLWLAFVIACKRVYPVVDQANVADFMQNRADLRLVVRIVVHQTRATQIQRSLRAAMIRWESKAVSRIQASTRNYLQSKRRLEVQEKAVASAEPDARLEDADAPVTSVSPRTRESASPRSRPGGSNQSEEASDETQTSDKPRRRKLRRRRRASGPRQPERRRFLRTPLLPKLRKHVKTRPLGHDPDL